MLKQLGTLYVVKPENLKMVISEGTLARIDPPLLLPFLMMRTDWKRFEKMEKEIFRGK